MKIIDKVMENYKRNFMELHCPSDYGYLELWNMDSTGSCPEVIKNGYGACEKCWNREIEDSDK